MRFLVIRSLYLENVSRFPHSSSLKWYSVGRIHLASTFFSCLDTRKESKRKSRPLPRPGKLAGYMMEIENVMRFQIIRSLYLKNAIRFAYSPSSGWHPVGSMQYAPTRDLKKSMRFKDQSCTRSTSSASAEALIFFCLLFFHQGKKRR